MKIWFTKEFWQWYYNRHRNVFRYWFAVLSSRPVIVSAKIAFGAFMGICVFKIIQLILFLIWGAATLPVTESPISFLGFVFSGAVGGVFISEGIIMTRVFNAMILGKKENPAPASDPAVPAIQPVATLAVAPVALPAVATHKFPYPIPAGTDWENFKFEFVDEHNLKIRVGQWEHIANYKDMDMADGRQNDPGPNQQWLFLKVLAKLGGQISYKNNEARWAIKKQKQLLSDKLTEYFGIDYDPFHPYKQFHKYIIKPTLKPVEDNVVVQEAERETAAAQFIEPGVEQYKEKLPGNLSDEEEDKKLIEGILDEQDAKRAGLRIRRLP